MAKLEGEVSFPRQIFPFQRFWQSTQQKGTSFKAKKQLESFDIEDITTFQLLWIHSCAAQASWLTSQSKWQQAHSS